MFIYIFKYIYADNNPMSIFCYYLNGITSWSGKYNRKPIDILYNRNILYYDLKLFISYVFVKKLELLIFPMFYM